MDTTTKAVAQWKTEEPAAQEECTEGALAHNKGVAEQAVSINAQLRAYKSNLGPLGSADPLCPLRIKELYSLMNQPDSLLAYLWARRNIDDWKLKFGRVISPHVPTKHCAKFAPSCMVDGEKCLSCVKRRKTYLEVLKPLRSAITRAFNTMRGNEFGLFACLLWPDGPKYFDIMLVLERPECYLAMPIHAVDKFYPRVQLAFGDYPPPKSCILQVDDVFNGESRCLIDYCIDRNIGCPSHFMFSPK